VNQTLEAYSHMS